MAFSFYGQDTTLLTTRCWVLEKAGFRVLTATDLSEIANIILAQHIDLLILGHTLSIQECKNPLAATHALQPGMKTLMLAEFTLLHSTEYVDEVVSSFDGPSHLIATAEKMLTRG